MEILGNLLGGHYNRITLIVNLIRNRVHVSTFRLTCPVCSTLQIDKQDFMTLVQSASLIFKVA
jgi:hypothetical protein